jgi:hypothetical protein
MKLIVFILFPTVLFARTTYYISSSGDDAANGTSTSTSWATPNRIQLSVYTSGDSILFKRGDAFEGQFVDTLDGVVIGAYGSGARPIIYGDLRSGVNWTATPGQSGIYQTHTGAGTIMADYGCHQLIDTGWVQLSGIDIRSATPAQWGTFYSGLTAGRFGRSNDRETLFVHTIGDIPMPGTRDSVQFYRNANVIWNSSNCVVIRDLDLRNYNYGLSVVGSDSITTRCVSFRHCISPGVEYDAVTDGIIDSCYADSCANSPIYLKVTTKCVVRADTVKDTIVDIDGISYPGGDKAGIGIQGTYSSGIEYAAGYGFNTIEYNLLDNASPIDFWYNRGDTIRYNTGINCSKGVFPHGTDLVINNNTVTFVGVYGQGMNGTNLGNGTITITGNIFSGVLGWGIAMANDSGATGGTVVVSGNTIKSVGTSSTPFVYFHGVGVSSTGNVFCGSGGFRDYPTYYNTLALFQAQGFESGSVYYSDCDSIPTAKSYLRWRK